MAYREILEGGSQLGKRHFLDVPEDPQYPPLLLGNAKLLEDLPKPGHNGVERAVEHHGQGAAELLNGQGGLLSLPSELLIS